MKNFLTVAVYVVATFLFFYVLVTAIEKLGDGLSTELSTASEKYKEQVGQRCIIDKDTLLIVDYSYFNNQFTLSNGTKVAGEIVFNQNK